MSSPVTTTVPLFFGPPHTRLFGVFHPAGGATQRDSAIIVCGPVGEEAILSHRVLRVLAGHLAKKGYPTLRFDLHGSGDSLGDDLDITLQRCGQSVATAASEARSLSGASRIFAIGLGMGANSICDAAERFPGLLSGFALWNPVVDGNNYVRQVQELATQHREPQVPVTPVEPGGPVAFECLGFRFSRDFLEELLALSFAGRPLPAEADVIVLDTAEELAGQALSLPGASSRKLPHHISMPELKWRPLTANGASVPAAALSALVAAVAARW